MDIGKPSKYQVFYDTDEKMWKVMKGNKNISKHRKKSRAVKRGKAKARSANSEIAIFKKNDALQERIDYSK